MGKEAGLKFVYLGNVPGHHKDNTYCPQCDALLIERRGFTVKQNLMDNGHCFSCGERLPGVGWNW
jgi:pyruvate formate lyase activating enzyme